MDKFLICCRFFSLCKLPAIRDYWSNNILGSNLIRLLFTRCRFEQIKHGLMVCNPSAEENAADRISKFRPFHDAVHQIIQGFWTPSPNQALDESQQQCAHRNSRCSHRGETNKPLSDYMKIISSHDSSNGYCNAFVVDERLPNKTVLDMVLEVLDQYPDATKFDPNTINAELAEPERLRDGGDDSDDEEAARMARARAAAGYSPGQNVSPQPQKKAKWPRQKPKPRPRPKPKPRPRPRPRPRPSATVG